MPKYARRSTLPTAAAPSAPCQEGKVDMDIRTPVKRQPTVEDESDSSIVSKLTVRRLSQFLAATSPKAFGSFAESTNQCSESGAEDLFSEPETACPTPRANDELNISFTSSAAAPEKDTTATTTDDAETEDGEDNLAPIVTHYVPPPTHKYPSATMHFLRASLGGDVGIAATVTGIAMIPVAAIALGVSVLNVYLIVAALIFVKYCTSNAIFWYHHMRPNATEIRASRLVGKTTKPFLMRRVKTRPHAQRKGKTVWVPEITEEEFKQRGPAINGITLFEYFHDLFTWALEYKVAALYRLICCDFSLGVFNTTHVSQEDPYFIMLNSSLACYIDVEDEGKFKMYDTILPHPTKGDKFISLYYVMSELDHVNQKHIRTTIQWEKAKEGCRPEVTTFTDATEAACLYSMIGGMKSHVHIHWWCNATQDLVDVWPLAKLSNSLSQGFNSAAQFSTGPVFSHPDASGMTKVLSNNCLVEGIPVHSDMGSIADNSLMHRMTKACRVALKEVAPHLTMLQIEAILQSTVMHAADHHYTASVLPWKCYFHLLDAEITLYRASLAQGTFYRTRKLLCRHYQDVDPICRVIYQCCHEVDPYFADHYLTVGMAA